PHLPLDTDVTIAVAQSRRAVERLAAEGVRAFVLPPISYGITRFTEGFAGRVTLRPGTLWALLEDVVLSLEQDGVRRIVFSNGHLEPEHVQVLRGVVLDHAELGPGRAHAIFPDNTRRRFAGTLGDEFASGDCHAGSYETSIVLAADPDGVRRRELAALAPKQVDLVKKMRAGARNFLEVGATEAFCGDPAAATAEEGERRIDGLADMLVVSVREAWPELFG
ncbi:MAG: creatininase family protein, partial [Gemmatimonadetes bacterium]|nr:creatininase family protein [Gemmatimonadota bacterium]